MLETLLAQTGSIDGRVQELETSKQSMENQIQELEKGLQVKADKSAVMNIDDRLKQLEQQIQSNEPEQASQGTIRTTVETMVNKQLGEDRDLAARKLNIILYRVPEPNSTTPDENRNQDLNFLEDFCQEGLNIDVKRDVVNKIYRLGKREADKVRPLLIGLKNPDVKSRLMSNLKNLKNARECYKSISVAHDLTPGQRQQVKELLSQSKDTLSENEKLIVVGQNGKPRIRKIKIQNRSSAQQEQA